MLLLFVDVNVVILSRCITAYNIVRTGLRQVYQHARSPEHVSAVPPVVQTSGDRQQRHLQGSPRGETAKTQMR